MKRKNNLKALLISSLWYITALPLTGCFEKQRDPTKSANTSNSPVNANTPPNAPGKNSISPTPKGTAYPAHTDTLSKTERSESSKQSTVETSAGSNATALVNEVPKIAQAHGRDANTEATQIRLRLEDVCNEVEYYIDYIPGKEAIYGKAILKEKEIEAYLERAIKADGNIQVPKDQLALLESLRMLLNTSITIEQEIIAFQTLFPRLFTHLKEVNKALTDLTDLTDLRKMRKDEICNIYRVAKNSFNIPVKCIKNATAKEGKMMQKLEEVIKLPIILNNSTTQNAIERIDNEIAAIKKLENQVRVLSSFTHKVEFNLLDLENICERANKVHNIGQYELVSSLISVQKSLLIIEKNVLQSLRATL